MIKSLGMFCTHYYSCSLQTHNWFAQIKFHSFLPRRNPWAGVVWKCSSPKAAVTVRNLWIVGYWILTLQVGFPWIIYMKANNNGTHDHRERRDWGWVIDRKDTGWLGDLWWTLGMISWRVRVVGKISTSMWSGPPPFVESVLYERHLLLE